MMRWEAFRFAWLLTMAAAVPISCHCTSDQALSASGDVTPDAATGADSGADGASDAPLETAVPDAGPDADAEPQYGFAETCNGPAASDPIPAGFPSDAKRLPGLPGDVQVFQLSQPGEPLSWVSCGTGCRELETPWAEPSEGPMYGNTGASVEDGKPWLALGQRRGGQVLEWVGPVDGNPLEAFVYQDSTAAGAPFMLPAQSTTNIFAVYAQQSKWLFGRQADGSVACLAKPTADVVIENGALSISRWAVTGDAAMRILSGPWPAAADGSGLMQILGPGEEHAVMPFGSGFTWTSYVEPHPAIWAWQPGGQSQAMLGSGTDDSCCANHDDQSFVWLQGRGYHLVSGVAQWDTIDMMVEPMTQVTTLPLAGKVLRAFPDQTLLGISGVMFGGYRAESALDPSSGTPFVAVTRIADGRLWRIPYRGTDRYWAGVLYVTDKEVAIAESLRSSIPSWMATIVRFDLSSLGPGEAP